MSGCKSMLAHVACTLLLAGSTFAADNHPNLSSSSSLSDKSELVDFNPPNVLISSAARAQSKRRVVFTFEWNQDVSGTSDQAFGASDVILTASDGKQLAFRDFSELAETSKSVANDAYYGDGVAKVDYMTGGVHRGRKYVGVVIAPELGWIEAEVPAMSVCSKSGLCNLDSHIVRVNVAPMLPECVRVSSKVIRSASLAVPLTFDFAEDVAVGAFKPHHVVGHSYSLDEALPEVPLSISEIVGGPRRFFATLESYNYPLLNLVEVWVKGAKVRMAQGGRFCQSNHFRVKLDSKAFLMASNDKAPQNRQSAGLLLPYGSSNQPIAFSAPIARPWSESAVGQPGSATTQNIADESITTVKLGLNAVQYSNVMDGAVTGVKIANGAIATSKFHDGAVTVSKLANGVVDTNALGDQSVTDDKMVDIVIDKELMGVDAVDAGSIVPGAITKMHIADGGVELGAFGEGSVTSYKLKGEIMLTGKNIADGAVQAADIADGAVTEKKISPNLSKILKDAVTSKILAPGSVTALKIRQDSVTEKKLAHGALSAGDLQDAAVTGNKISDEAVTTRSLAEGSVGSEQFVFEGQYGYQWIKDGSVPVYKLDPALLSEFGLSENVIRSDMVKNRQIEARSIADDAVTNIKIARGGIAAKDLAPGSVTRDKIMPASVVAAHLKTGAGVIASNLANNAIPTTALIDGTVQNVNIGDGAVDTLHLEDGIVTRTKLGDSAVGRSNIVDKSIGNAQVGASTVSGDVIANGGVTWAKIMPGSIAGANIAPGTIGADHIPAQSVTSNILSSTAVTADHLVDMAVQKLNLKEGAVVASALADGAVTGDMIREGAVTGPNYGKQSVKSIPDSSVKASKIADGGIGEKDIVGTFGDNGLSSFKKGSISNHGLAENAIQKSQLLDGSVTATKVRDLGVSKEDLASLAITSDKLGPQSVPGAALRGGSVLNTALRDGAVTYRSLDANAVSDKDIFDQVPIIAGNLIGDGAVNSAQLVDNSVGSVQIASFSVKGANIATGAVVQDAVADGAVTGRSYADGVVNQKHMPIETVTAKKIKDGAVEDRHIADFAVTAGKLAPLSVHSDAIATDSVSESHLAENVLFSTFQIGDGAVETKHIVDNSVSSAKIGEGSVQGDAFADNSIAADLIPDGSVVSRHFADRSITTSNIEGVDIINTAQLADESVHGRAFADGSITINKVQDGAASNGAFSDGGVLRDAISRDAVSSSSIPEGGIRGSPTYPSVFIVGAVTASKITEGSVDSAALADGSIGSDHLADQVEWRHVSDGAFRGDVFSSGSVTSAKLQDNAVSASKIADGNVTSSKIPANLNIERVVADDTVFEFNFAEGAITSNHIQDGAVVRLQIGGGVTTSAIPDNGLDADKLKNGGFTDYALENKTLTNIPEIPTQKIADLGVPTSAFNKESITASMIGGIGGIKSQPYFEHSFKAENVKLDFMSLPNSKFMDKGLEGVSFADLVANARTISKAGVTGGDFAEGAITGAKLAGDVHESKISLVAGADLTSDAVGADHIPLRSITGQKVADKTLGERVFIASAIDSSKVADGGLGNNVFAVNSILLANTDFSATANPILEDDVTTFELRNGGVANVDLLDDAVTTPKIASSGVQSSNFAKGGVSGDNFGTNSVTPDHILGGSVGPGPSAEQAGVAFASNNLGLKKIVDGAVTAATLKDSSVGGDSLQDGIIDLNFIAGGSAHDRDFEKGAITASKLQDNIVQAGSLAADSVTSDKKFLDGSISDEKLRLATVTGKQIAGASLSWAQAQESVFAQASEAVKLIDLVEVTVSAIDSRCRVGNAAQARSMHPMSIDGTMRGPKRRTMQDHHSFCARRGLGKAVKVMSAETNTFTQALGKPLTTNAATSMAVSSSSLVAVALVFILGFL